MEKFSKESPVLEEIFKLGKTIDNPECMFSFSSILEDLSKLLASSKTNEEKLYANYYLLYKLWL